jgi:dolichol-phosphate mannosyltransferase
MADSGIDSKKRPEGNRQVEEPAARPVPPWRRPPTTIFVVLPAYNEENSLGLLLEQIDQSMHEDGFAYQVIVVDDGSRDRTVAVAKEHAPYMPIRVEQHEANQGLGATIRDGLRVAAGLCAEQDIIVSMDADNTHTPRLIRTMVRSILEGSDVVIASRYRKGSYIRGVPFHRRLLSFGAYLVCKLVFPIPGVRDYTSGYRAYRAKVLQDAFALYGNDFINEGGFQCMLDILLKLRRMDVIFREAPLILRYDLKGGSSQMKVLRTIVATLSLLLRRRFGK